MTNTTESLKTSTVESDDAPEPLSPPQGEAESQTRMICDLSEGNAFVEEYRKPHVPVPNTAALTADNANRPGGTSCRIQADTDKGPLALILTEFPDPGGQNVYFRIADSQATSRDELLTEER